MVANLINFDSKSLDRICRQHHVRRLSMFGSLVRGDATAQSEVDLLLEYESDVRPTFFDILELAEALEPVFGGRKVDLVFPETLHWHIRDEVLNSARVVYER